MRMGNDTWRHLDKERPLCLGPEFHSRILPSLARIHARIEHVPFYTWLRHKIIYWDENYDWALTTLFKVLGGSAATPEVLDGFAIVLADINMRVRWLGAHAIEGIGASAATPEFLDRLADLLLVCDEEEPPASEGSGRSVGPLVGGKSGPDARRHRGHA